MPEPERPEKPAEAEIADILDGYRQSFASGADPDPEAFIESYSERAPDLADCLQGLAAMEELREALQVDQVSASSTPRWFGAFHLVREIGRGGMGVVWEAIHTRLNRRVAIKMIKAGTLADDRDLELFHKEALAAASLQHPNIVQLFEFGEEDGQPYLVLEYVDGGSLDARLAGAPIDPYQAARLLAILAHAMHYAHERGIIHRDLKPANVLLLHDDTPAQSGPMSHPKITDFGLAKHLHADDGQTQSGGVKGTPSYMAPEQATGNASGTAIDVYALGAILYETITGRPPFRAATALDTLVQVTSLEPVAPRKLQPSVPRDLETICLKCLQKDPRRRYTSARELAEDLERFLRHEPIHARPVGLGGRVWRWVRRNRLVASLLSVAATLAVLVATLVVMRLVDERLQRERVLADNVFAANHLANTILVELWRMAEAVDRAANDPQLRRLLKEDRARLQPLPIDSDPSRPRFALPEDQRRLQPYLEAIHKKGEFTFHSWHVVDNDGILLADAPPSAISVFGVTFQGRDYFHGAKRHVGTMGRARVHVSRAYQSANDKLFKITLSALVYDAANEKVPIGVLCATLPTDANLGLLDLTDPDHLAVLVGAMDANDPHQVPRPESRPSQYMVLVHPGYGELPEFGQGKKAMLVPPEMLPLTPQRHADGKDEFVPRPRSIAAAALARHDAYEDPLGKAYPAKYGKHWLAGFAQVGNTELVVIVQSRRQEWTDAYGLLLGAGTLLAAGLVGIALWRLRARRRPASVGQDQSAPTIAFKS